MRVARGKRRRQSERACAALLLLLPPLGSNPLLTLRGPTPRPCSCEEDRDENAKRQRGGSSGAFSNYLREPTGRGGGRRQGGGGGGRWGGRRWGGRGGGKTNKPSRAW